MRPCRHNRSVEACLIVEGGTSRTGAKRAGECDGLTGLPEANAGGPGPQATVPTCAGTTRFRAPGCGSSPYGDRRKVAAALKAVYTAPNQEAAWQALTDFSESDMGVKHPSDGDDLGAVHPSFWTHRPMLRRVISPPTSWEVPPPPTHRGCELPAAQGSPMNRGHVPFR